MQKDIGKSKKYIEVYEKLKNEIDEQCFSPDNPLPSESVLCQKYCASKITIRHALDKLEQEGIISKHHGRTARIVSKNRLYNPAVHGKIGILSMDIKGSIFPSVVQNMTSYLSCNGFGSEVCFYESRVDKKRQALEHIMNYNLDGLIIEGIHTVYPCPNQDLYDEIINGRIPMVFTNGYHSEIPCSHVIASDRETTAQLVHYLYSLGHRKIGGVFSPSQWQSLRRYQGYIDGLLSHQLEYNDDWVVFYDFHELQTMFDIHFMRKKEELLQCTAFICYNDETADFLESTFVRAGYHVPEDISLVGIDGYLERSAMGSKITSAKFPIDPFSKATVDSLIYMLGTGDNAPDVTLPMELIIGDTTSSPCR